MILFSKRQRAAFLKLVSVAILMLSTGCATHTQRAPEQPQPVEKVVFRAEPLQQAGVFPVSPQEAHELSRNLSPATQKFGSWSDMRFAVEQSLAHTRAKPAQQMALATSGLRVTYGQMANGLERLRDLLPQLDAEPDRVPEMLSEAFVWWRIGPDFGFTGYHEPELLASPVRTERFRYPLYRTPPDMKKAKRKGPYFSRHAIDCKGALQGRNLEIAWVENSVDIFILQIQGSGRIRYEDGRSSYVLYDSHNGHKYVSLGRVMINRGIYTREQVNMPMIRRWLAEHPEQCTDLLDTNPSYVFFRVSSSPSRGSMGRILTPKISTATDQRVLPNGLLTFMQLDLPNAEGKHVRPFAGLMLPQDTGSAIKRNRVDIFCGSDSEAVQTSGYLDIKGAVYLLLPR